MSNKDSANNDYNIENFLEYSVENDEWLQILNNPKQLSTIICWDSLYQYMIEKNKEFCDKRCLCESCRSPIKENIEYVDGLISDIQWSCENGC
jgi:hypothetical protein